MYPNSFCRKLSLTNVNTSQGDQMTWKYEETDYYKTMGRHLVWYVLGWQYQEDLTRYLL